MGKEQPQAGDNAYKNLSAETATKKPQVITKQAGLWGIYPTLLYFYHLY